MERLYYTVEGLAKMWGVGISTIYMLLRTKELKGFKVGGSWRISSDAVFEYENADNSAKEKPVLPKRGSVLRIS